MNAKPMDELLLMVRDDHRERVRERIKGMRPDHARAYVKKTIELLNRRSKP